MATSTPEGEYRVHLDVANTLHSQMHLCYAIDGMPLTGDYDARTRFVIPSTCGVKRIKRIGRIAFTDARPPDYSAKRGYDRFAGL